MATGLDTDRALHVVAGPVDQSAFAEIRASLNAEVLFPQMPWELRQEENRIIVASNRGVVLAEIYEPSAAHLMASAAGMWLTILGLIPVIERHDPVLGQELVARLQYFLGMQAMGGASSCDANNGTGDGRR